MIQAPTPEVLQDWLSGLHDVSNEHLMIGLRKAENFQGYFSLPAFRELCRITPEDIGLPSVESAYVEACNARTPKRLHKWSHPAVYHAGADTGWFDLGSGLHGVRDRFAEHYAKRCRQVIQGERLTIPKHEALPEKVSVNMTHEQIRAGIAKLRESLA